MKRYRIFLGFLFLFLPWTCYANFDPTEILRALIKIYDVENQHLPNLDDLKAIKTTENNLKQDIERNLQGHFGYGSLFNGPEDLIKRQWSNASWEDVLNEVNNHETSAFFQAQERYKKLYSVVDPSRIGTSLKDTDLTRVYYQEESHISRATLAASSYSYDQINTHIETIHDILKKLDDQPSEIAAVQLNARLVAEVAFIQLEMLKQQTMNNQLIATQSQDEVNGMSDAAQFMQWQPHS